MTRRNKSSESGFSLAVLIFFLTAVSIVIAATVPSFQMQARRAQEEELIFRGEEYMRAIQKFQRKTGTYPPSIDALLQTNGLRFLRRQYTDPITGKPFRLIYINPDGTLTGSVVFKTMTQLTSAQSSNTGNGNTANTGNTSGSGNPATGIGNSAGSPQSGGLSSTASGTPQSIFGGAIPQAGNTSGIGNRAGGSGIAQQPGATRGANSNPGLANSGTANGPGNSTPVAAGIVGVGSESDLESIKVYNTHQHYNEWEFIAIMQPNSNTGQPNNPQNPQNPQNNGNRGNSGQPQTPTGIRPLNPQPGATPPSMFGPQPQPQPQPLRRP